MPVTLEIQDDIGPLANDWQRLAEHTKTSPFLWPGWINAWWRAFGTGQLQILTVYENGRLSGLLPLRRSGGVLASLTNPHTPLFSFLAANEAATKELLDGLFSQEPHRVDLAYMAPADPGISLTRAAADNARYRVFTESIPAAPYVATDGDWGAYEGSLRGKFRSEIRRRRRRLEEEGRLELEVSDGKESLEELLEEGFHVEGSGWKEAYGTSINSHPATRRFYTEVARWATERGWLRLAFLRLSGRTLAFDYGLEFNKTHYLVKTGYDPAYRKYAPGMILRYMMLARAFSSDIVTYDFLGEDYGWKREWTSEQQERLFLHMFAPSVLGSLNRAAFMYGQPASERATSLARSVLGERGRHLLKRGRALARERISHLGLHG